MLAVAFALEGDLARVRVPEARPRCVTDRLWQHTCFEVFLMRPPLPGYYEFNLAPSGEWAVYAFARYRERAPLSDRVSAQTLEPHIGTRRQPDRLELDAFIALDRLVPDFSTATLALGLSAVVEAQDGARSYWALRHATEEPDFHHPDSFAVTLDEVRT
ncbi:MAG TPA: DOMON-like domain-containing protein [Burkholderiales bacterium]